MGQAGDPHSRTEGPNMAHLGQRRKAHWKRTQNIMQTVSKGFVRPVTFGSGTELSQTHGIP